MLLFLYDEISKERKEEDCPLPVRVVSLSYKFLTKAEGALAVACVNRHEQTTSRRNLRERLSHTGGGREMNVKSVLQNMEQKRNMLLSVISCVIVRHGVPNTINLLFVKIRII